MPAPWNAWPPYMGEIRRKVEKLCTGLFWWPIGVTKLSDTPTGFRIDVKLAGLVACVQAVRGSDEPHEAEIVIRVLYSIAKNGPGARAAVGWLLEHPELQDVKDTIDQWPARYEGSMASVWVESPLSGYVFTEGYDFLPTKDQSEKETDWTLGNVSTWLQKAVAELNWVESGLATDLNKKARLWAVLMVRAWHRTRARAFTGGGFEVERVLNEQEFLRRVTSARLPDSGSDIVLTRELLRQLKAFETHPFDHPVVAVEAHSHRAALRLIVERLQAKYVVFLAFAEDGWDVPSEELPPPQFASAAFRRTISFDGLFFAWLFGRDEMNKLVSDGALREFTCPCITAGTLKELFIERKAVVVVHHSILKNEQIRAAAKRSKQFRSYIEDLPSIVREDKPGPQLLANFAAAFGADKVLYVR